MCRWAVERGADATYLQVVEENQRVARLREKLGFADLYSYTYWLAAT